MAIESEAQLLERSGAGGAAAPTPRGGFHGGYEAQLDEGDVIRQFVPVVKRLALRLRGRMPETVQLDDLIQAGLIAVLRLARLGGVTPPTDPLLHRSIINAMIDEARRETWAPVRTLRLAKAASEAMRAVKLRLGRDGNDDEIAGELQIGLGDYHALLVEIAGINLLHIDEFDDSGDRGLSVDDNQDAALDRSRMMAALAESIAALPEREKLVLSLYYEQELNMEEVGNVLGLDKSTVCRAHGRALLMLRDVLADWRGEAAEPPSGSGD
ncbi:MAG TPA: sigma-70 family RNA polymerase sigma factor [Stellaceae bacterium]|nr:sigma-70 family RNA polymerase sigma factor [Stellaceae bacterium]